METKDKIILLAFSAIATLLIFGSLYGMWINRRFKKKVEEDAKEGKTVTKAVLERQNGSKFLSGIQKSGGSELNNIFYKAKNPWNLTPGIFQCIRYIGALSCLVIGGIVMMADKGIAFFIFAIAFLFFWYPMYYYKAVGDEREAEWNKVYEFIWVLKHNAMMYDASKVFLNTANYIKDHAPHNKEIIEGFFDFYNYWDPDQIPEYIQKYYAFPVPKEIFAILYNMQLTGQFPEEQLNTLRQFIINQQDLAVERTLSSVSSKATIFSLPFMMISVILALMVPMVIQIIEFM